MLVILRIGKVKAKFKVLLVSCNKSTSTKTTLVIIIAIYWVRLCRAVRSG